ncbi:GrpB family protein [Acinetobacter sp. WCHAc060025]|uniref:GrpB family protein n=1 Tax=Acinetobacter sp. WCHAc060025 TaxID=2518625 RepID=UPI001022E150|nr:GrpB family protein [Acinetobacter sp. WCHAc060025]RZG77815.1 GrpB family protein [Acinetobacter sp. WCHAc060025]
MKFYASEEYQPHCQKLFEHYQRKIKLVIPNALIEHIGASSIPHAISKGDLDIYIAVEQFVFENAIQKLITLNFQEKKETLRTHQLCMLESLNNDEVALQLIVKGSEFESFIIFRDTLRQSSELVQQYNALKSRCSHLNMDDYRSEKNMFIAKVLRNPTQKTIKNAL